MNNIDRKTLDKAREWAGDEKANWRTQSRNTRAAAEVIRSLPDQWVNADKLREVVADHHIDMSEELMEALGALLPDTPAPPTMAEIEWDYAEHHLAEASVAEYNLDGNISDTVIMLKINEFGNIWALDTSTWGAWALSKDTLTPTGKKYRLEPEDDTPAPSIEDKPAPEPATPRPEHVPAGEPWQVEVDGETAIGFRNDPEDLWPWCVTYQVNSRSDWLGDNDVALIARLVPETTEQDDTETAATDG